MSSAQAAAVPAFPHSYSVLIVASDALVHEEFTTAFAGVRDVRAVMHRADSYRQALEIARAREPRLVVIEIDRDVASVAELANAIHTLVPAAVLLAIFRSDQLEQTHSESGTIIQLLRARVSDFLRRPLSTTELRAVLDRVSTHDADTRSGGLGRVTAFISNKGGVGKSTMAVNVACALAQRHPDGVLLIDTSLQLGTCAAMLALSPTSTIADAVRQGSRLDETLLKQLCLKHPTGLRVLAAPVDALEAADIDDEGVARIITLARRSFRHVIVDTFPILDSVVMAVLDLTDTAFVVVQGTAPSVAGGARLLPVLEGLGLAPFRQRLVLNYNYRNFLGNLAPGDISERLGRPLDFVVEYEKRNLVAVNTGVPYILSAGSWSRFRRTIEALVTEIDTAPLSRRSDDVDPSRLQYEGPDRRRVDRRLRDIGRPEGERRSGIDRRTGTASVDVRARQEAHHD
ncbi:MAG: AAA family ATPase [Vicinamibacterales bacterium]